jgi:hypothetical protein
VILHHGPIGKLVQGHVLDVDVKGFNRALQDLDKRLYTRWNPEKLRGWGCWEIRVKPRMKTPLYMGTFEGHDIYSLEDLEINAVHHVLDCAYLNYDAIRKLKEMDTYNPEHFIHDMEYREQQQANAVDEKARAERKYAMQYYKTAIKDLYERVRSGESLHRILGESKWAMKIDSQS